MADRNDDARCILENQGLRSTSRGGHLAVIDAVRSQLDPPMGQVLRPADRMRRRRNDAECPSSDVPALSPVREDAGKVDAIVELATKVLDEMSPF
jgi:hypothetical protein